MSRPTTCTTVITNEICQRLAGGESLRRICKDETLPVVSTVLLWVVSGRIIEDTGKQFSEHYMQARDAAGFSHADSVADIAYRALEEGLDPQSARAAMDGYKWAAERMSPKKHSQRQEHDITTNGQSMRPQTIITTDPIEAAKQYQDIMGRNE